MSPTNDSAMSWTKAILAHLAVSMERSLINMVETPIRYMWSAMDSHTGIPWSTQPVRRWDLSKDTIWRKRETYETGFDSETSESNDCICGGMADSTVHCVSSAADIV
ncbi:hypothetical protein WICPIJ_002362 [Wickerhamomyces pijperi]|uniref:Uncharacterized protein n=1 Tax=Wickerhamomyces pijperi TaxID=599730 RepID=A0A9P8QBY9_WICPI|nr:hypothetical protein WICPIJ_002362 [Wickerhamomyces pijperi]